MCLPTRSLHFFFLPQLLTKSQRKVGDTGNAGICAFLQAVKPLGKKRRTLPPLKQAAWAVGAPCTKNDTRRRTNLRVSKRNTYLIVGWFFKTAKRAISSLAAF